MTDYTRIIDRQTTNAVPTWAVGMATNTLYEIGNLPTTVHSQFIWPETVHFGGGLYSGLAGRTPNFWDSFGSSVFIPEIGAHGAMAFWGSGENTFQEQGAYFDLSANDPTWKPLNHPGYQISAANAALAGTTWYFDQAAYNALSSSNPSRIIPWFPSTSNHPAEVAWAATWDRQFPVGRAGFIITGKSLYSELGNNTPCHFRYNMPVYLPPSMTGWADGAVLINDRSFAGSFSGSSGPPGGVTPAEWYADIWGSGRRKYWAFAMNVRTRLCTRIPLPVPDFVDTFINNVSVPFAFVDTTAKRVYYTAYANSTDALYYCDFTAGVAGATWSGPTNMTGPGVGSGYSQSGNSLMCEIVTGPLAGKKLFYFKAAATENLGLIEVPSGQIYYINLSNPPRAGGWRFSFDPATNRVFVTTRSNVPDFQCTQFVIPTGYTNASNYITSTQPIVPAAGVIPEATGSSGVQGYAFGQRSHFLPIDGGRIMINQGYGKMLVFKPS